MTASTTSLPQNYRESFDEAIANMFSNPKYASNYLFYAHMVGQCHVAFDSEMQAPAGVNFMHDHFNLYINPTLFSKFTIEQRLGILKHEMLHILFNHIRRKEDRDHTAFNYATDCAINQQIDRTHLPEGCIYPDNFPSTKEVPNNLTAEQYYELLDKSFSDEGDGSGSGDGNGTSRSKSGKQGKLLDDHGKWGESEGDSELQDDIAKNMIERSISNTEKSRGGVPSQISDWLSLVSHKRELNWKQVLRNIVGNKRVGSKKTLLRRDRRLPNFEWIKGRTKDRKFDLLLISDVSGSVSDTALLSLWGEVRNICDVTNTPVNLIQVDTRPCKPEQLKKTTKSIERKACGGTILHPALDMAKDHKLDYNAIVVTTDGYLCSDDVLAFAATNKRVIWLIESDGHIMDEMNTGNMQAFQLKA